MRETIASIFWQFAKLALVGWGGPIARMALLHEEFVRKKKWMSEKHFAKILALYQVLPGPEATELAVYMGYKKKKFFGGLLSGLGFMLPGFLLMLCATWLYATYSLKLTLLQGILYGIKPAAVALIACAFITIAKSSITKWYEVLIAGAAAIAFLFFKLNFVLVLLAGGIIVWLMTRHRVYALVLFIPIAIPSVPIVFWVFLKAGLFTFGGAYSVVPFIYQEAVQHYSWLTTEQYVDGIAIAQMLPAPLSIVGTFAGYFAHGFFGAVLATIGIFLPAFFFTLAGFNTIERVANNKRLRDFLYGVTAAVVGLIFATFIELMQIAVIDGTTFFIAIVAFFLFWRKTNIAVVMLGSCLLGYIVHFWG